MANNFQRGDLIRVYVGGGEVGFFELNIRSHNLDMEVLRHDVSGTKHRGGTARIAGKHDSRATVEAAFDLDEAPYAIPPALIEGSSGILLLGLSPTKAIQIPCIIGKVHYEAAVDTEVRYSFDVEENVLAGTVARGVDTA